MFVPARLRKIPVLGLAPFALELLACHKHGVEQRHTLETVSAQTPAVQNAPPLPASANARADSPLPESGCPDQAEGAVRVIDATHCEVSKAVFFGDNECLLARPDLVPASVAGRVIGFRNESLRRKSVFALCGIRSGDIWIRVNSRSLATPDDALELYGKLRESDKLVFELVRGGKNIQLQITFR